ncbi:MAG TPA: 2-oxoacid:ferredoxin oxidoreductase subunit beta [Cryomorphaceae bacterium]|nr:2-oxoacid:ferredoxin oxidoreductase subunit beta [Cryomorphaceae bacterium]
MNTEAPTYTPKDFATDQEVRWCPGCGDYSILKQVQSVLPDAGFPKEKIVFISGIGCSSRFPYYMDTYGMHGIHGRAPAIAAGLKIANPDLSVWVITGDGDSLSIGGNHLIHALRRNFDINILLFNNEIYGLTKGQYSPTSPEGKVTKSTPMGSVDHPFNPLALARGAGGTFIARALDRDPKHLRVVLNEANRHKGTSLVEIYQNCNVFNDGAFEVFTDKATKAETTIFVEDGQPLVFGENDSKGIVLDGAQPRVVNLENGEASKNDLWVHDSSNRFKAATLLRCFDAPDAAAGCLPRPFGVIFKEDKTCYEDLLHGQIQTAIDTKGPGDLDALLRGENTWEIV